jgi:tRNA(fMet)-specific endonuclease VapC
MYLLDTNACIRVLNGSSGPLVARMRSHAPSEIRISSVTRAELLYGARRSARVAENLRLLAAFFAPLVSLPFDDASAEQYGALRASLAAVGRPIGPNDLLIAATALAHDLTLVTHNLREFSRITGLKIEDWEQAAL